MTAGTIVLTAASGGNSITWTLQQQHGQSAASGSTVDLGGAYSALTDNGDHNTIVLSATGEKWLVGNVLGNGDVLDVRAALGTTSWNHDAATVGSYITSSNIAGGLQIDLHATAVERRMRLA